MPCRALGLNDSFQKRLFCMRRVVLTSMRRRPTRALRHCLPWVASKRHWRCRRGAEADGADGAAGALAPRRCCPCRRCVLAAHDGAALVGAPAGDDAPATSRTPPTPTGTSPMPRWSLAGHRTAALLLPRTSNTAPRCNGAAGHELAGGVAGRRRAASASTVPAACRPAQPARCCCTEELRCVQAVICMARPSAASAAPPTVLRNREDTCRWADLGDQADAVGVASCALHCPRPRCAGQRGHSRARPRGCNRGWSCAAPSEALSMTTVPSRALLDQLRASASTSRPAMQSCSSGSWCRRITRRRAGPHRAGRRPVAPASGPFQTGAGLRQPAVRRP